MMSLQITIFVMIMTTILAVSNRSKIYDWTQNQEWVSRAERINKGLESGVTWKDGVIEESYDPEIEEVYLVDEKGTPQGFDSFGSGSTMFTGVPKGWKLIRVPRQSN